MKKLIYVIVFSLVISTFSFASGSSSSASANNIMNLSETNETYTESFELNGVHYLYEDTSNYTLTITKAPNGEEMIAYKDKHSSNEDEFYYYHKPANKETNNFKTNKNSSSLNATVSLLNTTDKQGLQLIKEQLLNKEIVLEKRLFDDFMAEPSKIKSLDEYASELPITTSSTGSLTPIQKIRYSLTAEYGSEFTNKYIGYSSQNGHTGYLYQQMTFGTTPKTSKFFDALTAIGVIATWAGTPITGIVGLAAWVSSAGGYYQLHNPSEFHTWTAVVYNMKEVKVGTVYPYRAYYDLTHTATVGSLGYASLTNPKIYKSSDYDNNASLLTTGINNYIRFH